MWGGRYSLSLRNDYKGFGEKVEFVSESEKRCMRLMAESWSVYLVCGRDFRPGSTTEKVV